ncbi:MAG: CvpA family protein [Mariniblastus sp.]
MSFYDIVMLVVMVGAVWFGYWKGLAWQVASVAAIGVSYFVSVNFRDYVSPYIQTAEPWNRIGAMLILFLGTSLIIWTIYASISKSLKKNELKGFDRQAGALLGAFKGALLCMVITMFAVSIMGERAHNAVDNSKFGPYVEQGIWTVSAYVPEEIASFVDPHIESYMEASGHPEGPTEPGGLFGQPGFDENGKPTGIFGSSYSADQNGVPQNQQNYPGTWLPPAQPPRFQQPAQPAGYQQPVRQNGYQNPGYQNGAGYQQPANSTGWGQAANTQTQNTQTRQVPPTSTGGWDPGFEISDASKQMLEPFRQKGEELKQQGQEFIRQQSAEMLKDAAEKTANKWFGNGQ